jgi:hypothetical protein
VVYGRYGVARARMNVRSKAALLAGATGLLLGTAELFLFRVTLLLLFVGGISLLCWTTIRQPALAARRTWIIWSAALLLGCAPMDVWPLPTGRVAVKVLPVVWGLPTASTARRIAAGELAGGGCIVPFHPPRYVVSISW